VLKRALRDDTIHEKILSESSKMRTRNDVVEHLRKRFGTKDWERTHRGSTIKRMEFSVAATEDINRPLGVKVYEKIPGIMKSFCFKALTAPGVAGQVAQRQWDCNCPACLDASLTMENQYVKNCRLGDSKTGVLNTEQFYACGVDREDAAGVAVRRNNTQAQGKKLAAECEQKPLGTFVAAQSRINTTDDFMVGELVDGGQGHGAVVKQVEARTEVVPGSGPDGATTFSRGDYVIAVRWYHRYEGDSTGRTWVKDPYDDDKHDVLNSTELRLIGFPMEAVQLPPPVQAAPLRRSGRNQAAATPPPPSPADDIVHLKMTEVTASAILTNNW